MSESDNIEVAKIYIEWDRSKRSLGSIVAELREIDGVEPIAGKSTERRP